jgi:hypothetical protein
MACRSTPIAAIRFAKGMDIDRLLIEVARSLSCAGLRLGGLVQVCSAAHEARLSASVHVVDLFTGDRFDIWEPRGRDARGCRLDEGRLAVAEAAVMRSIDAGLDLLVLNRFGRAESLGRGLLACFIKAVTEDIPVLTAVREPFDRAWADFHGGLAETLPPRVEAVDVWAGCLPGRILPATREPVPSPAGPGLLRS